MRALRHYLLAVQFFTRIPVTGRLADWVGFSPALLRASAAHFPGVGWLVGAVAAGVLWGLRLALGPSPFTVLVAAVASTAATAWMTGAFHEDGLADTADGLGGSAERERALAIMKDSRIGAYGATTVALALALKCALLAVLASRSLAAAALALWVGHAVSRFWPLLVIATLPHVGDGAQSKSKPLADRIGPGALAAGLLWCLPPAAAALALQPVGFLIAGLAASAVAWVALRRLLARRLQGFTGDTLGAVQQVCEIAFYLGAACALRPG